jgi:fructose-1,6-bisphosphatase/inositol monophosphatase family enzyme
LLYETETWGVGVRFTPEIPIEMASVKYLLLRASDIVSRLYQSGTAVFKKVDGSPLTQADTEVNEFLKETLLEKIPHAGWLSEETADNPDRLANDWVWVVDPLDGTIEFTRGIPEFAISVGLVFRQQAVMGGVINPATGEGGLGVVGGQLEFWGGKNQRTPASDLSDACATISRTEAEDGSVLPFIRCVGSAHPVGSVAYKLLRVAAGIDHLTISAQHKSEWDICGGVALLYAAGKVYRRFDGQSLRFNQRNTRILSGAVAGNEDIVSEFLTALDSKASY